MHNCVDFYACFGPYRISYGSFNSSPEEKNGPPSQILTNTYTCVRQYEPWLPHGIKLGHCVNLNQITKQNLHRHGTRYFKKEKTKPLHFVQKQTITQNMVRFRTKWREIRTIFTHISEKGEKNTKRNRQKQFGAGTQLLPQIAQILKFRFRWGKKNNKKTGTFSLPIHNT